MKISPRHFQVKTKIDTLITIVLVNIHISIVISNDLDKGRVEPLNLPQASDGIFTPLLRCLFDILLSKEEKYIVHYFL